jgi:hypothetical protein
MTKCFGIINLAVIKSSFQRIRIDAEIDQHIFCENKKLSMLTSSMWWFPSESDYR